MKKLALILVIVGCINWGGIGVLGVDLIGNIFGAGEGDRTLTAGLEGRNSTIELHPHI